MKRGGAITLKKSLGAFLFSILMPIFSFVSCFADVDAIDLKVDRTDLAAGDEIVVTADFPDDAKIYALTAALQYDQNVFELITSDNFDLPDVAALSYNPDNNHFGIINQTGAVDDGLLAFRLRVKETGNVGETNIALTNISTSDGSEKTTYPSASATVLVTKDATEGETVPINSPNSITELPDETQNVFYTTPFIIAALTIAIVLIIILFFYRHMTSTRRSSKITYSLSALIAICAVVAIALGAINHNKKDLNGDGTVGYDDAQAIVNYLISLDGTQPEDSRPDSFAEESTEESSAKSIASPLQFVGFNSYVDNASPSETPQTSSSSADSQNLPAFDTNNDGKVDINDAGHNAEEAQKATTVELLDSDEQSPYVEKGNTKFIFNAKISPADVTLVEAKVKVNHSEEKYYTVESENDHYVIHIDPLTDAGKTPILISEIRTSNDKTLTSPYHRELEVLKAAPAASLPVRDPNSHQITLGIIDPDQAFESGKAEIYSLTDQSEEPITSLDITSDNKNQFTLEPKLDDDKTYQLSVNANYCRSIAKNYECYENNVIYTQDIEVLKSYGFVLNDFSVSDYVRPTEKPTISFSSSNSKNLMATTARVKIDGDTIENSSLYKNSEGRYESTLNQANMSPGRHSVTLESVTLEGDKTFVNPTDFQVSDQLTYFVPNNIPSVTGLELKNDAEKSLINAFFRLNDDHATVTKLTLVMQDSTGNTVAREVIDRDDPRFSNIHSSGVDLVYPKTTKDRGFTVKVLADYDLGEKYSFSEQELATADIAAYDTGKLWISEIKSKINSNGKDAIYTRYTEKNNPKFYLELNTSKRSDPIFKPTGTYEYTEIGGYTVNGNNYVTSSVSRKEIEPTGQNNFDYTSTVNIGIPGQAGVLDMNVSRVQFINNKYYHQYSNWYSIPHSNYQIEVLRDAPKIENLSVDEDYDNRKVTFHFDVVVDETAQPSDQSFESGILRFGNLEQTFVERGANTVVFEGDQVPLDEIKELTFKATYDRDTDALNHLDDDKDSNQYTDDTIYSSQYGLFNPNQYQNVKLEDARALTNYKTVDDSLFKKNEKIGLYFVISGIPEQLNAPTKAKLEGYDQEFKLYKVVDTNGAIEPNRYAVFISGQSDSGLWSARISDIILENGKYISLDNTKSAPIAFEVLKDAPTISELEYAEDGYEYTVKTKLTDPDNSLIRDKTYVTVSNDFGEEIYRGPYSEEFTFESDASESYFITVSGDYGLSQDQNNHDPQYYHAGETLLNASISANEKYAELKDITDVNLYRLDNNNNLLLVDQVSKQEIASHLGQYFLELSMAGMPTIRIPIKEARESNGHLYLILASNYLTQEDGFKSHAPVKIDFGELDSSGQAHNEFHPAAAFNKLLDDLKNNRDIELTRDYDASAISNGNLAYYVESYQGKLNGNGHSIKNLTSPLIGELKSDSKIENLILENVKLTGSSARGALANTTGQVELKQILIHGITSASSGGQTGGLVGALGQNSLVDSCGITDLSLNVGGSQQTGGIIGIMGQDSILKNSYAIGTMNGSWNFRGGLVGNVVDNRTATVENSYAKVNLTSGGISCGLGCAYAGNLNVNNSISLSSNFNNAPISNRGKLSNNFFLKHSSNSSFVTIPNQQTLIEDKSDVNQTIFERAHFDSTTWRLNNDTSYDNPPRLAFEKLSTSRFETNAEYKSTNASTYHNLAMLSPYLESSDIVHAGNRLKNSVLTEKQIRLIAPLDDAGRLVTYLTNRDQDKIKKLNIVYTDGSSYTYDVGYSATFGMLATYRIKQLHADYTFPRYVINEDSRLVDNLTYYLKTLSYANNLDPLTPETDNRVTRDFFNSTTKNELREFVLKYLSNSNYADSSTNEAISTKIERDIKSNDRISKALYLYNFLRRYYDVKIGNIPLYDYLMFNMQNFDANLTMESVIDRFFDNTATNFNTAQTSTAYKNVFASSTGLDNLPKFLEYLVTHVGGISDMNAWTRSEFDGVLVEVSIDNNPDYDSGQGLTENTNAPNQNTGVLYTLWDHFSHAENNDENGYKGYNYLLPLLTMPKNSTYIISMPVQFIIGSQRVYIANPDDSNMHERILFRAKTYANRYKKYFTTAYGILGDKKLFNDMHIIQIDKTHSYNSDGTKTVQRFGSSEEPHFKNFNEVVGISPAEAGNNAASWGPYIEWQVAGVMDSILTEYYAKYQDEGNIWDNGANTFGTWSHETAHSIDARLFLRNQGRRFDAGGEDYADGFLRQQFDDKLIVMNLSRNFGLNCGYGANCDPERIDTQGEIYDFYSKAFDVIYTIDYIEALAFLQLSSEDMSKTGIQISYPNATGEDFDREGQENYKKYFPNGLGDPEVVEKAGYRAYLSTRYRQIDASAYDEMKSRGQLENIDDLYDNRLMIYPGIYQMSTRGSNLYGGEGLNVAHWYQPHNDYGRPDSYSLKWLSYEMMSIAGYDKGFIEYASNKDPIPHEIYTSFGSPQNLELSPATSINNTYKTDLMALRRVTGQDDLTFETYKKKRFAEIASKLKTLNTSVDVKDYVRKFYNALVSDAAYARANPNANGTSMPESTKLRIEIYQKLKNTTNDFTANDIYDSRYDQSFTDLDELRHLIEREQSND